MKTVILCAFFLAAGLGFGTMASSMWLMNEKPAILVETKWKTITTAPPVKYEPETPFHVDPAVICEPTTLPTILPVVVPTTRIPIVTTTTRPVMITTTTSIVPVTTSSEPSTTTTEE